MLARLEEKEIHLMTVTNVVGRSGQIGDGKVFVLDLPRCIRIRTGEEGNDAIG